MVFKRVSRSVGSGCQQCSASAGRNPFNFSSIFTVLGKFKFKVNARGEKNLIDKKEKKE